MLEQSVISHRGLDIDFDWLTSRVIETPDQASFAALVIRVNSSNATELEDRRARTVRGYARVSACQMALWFATNWWRLRWEPQRQTLSWAMSHRLGAAGGGYAWPDLSFSSDGDFVRVQSWPTSDWSGTPTRYLRTFDERLPVQEFERGIDHFMDAVIERIMVFPDLDTPLPALWAEVREERETPEIAAWRKLEALLGFDAGEAPDSLIASLQQYEAILSRSAVEEFAAAGPAETACNLQALLAAEETAIPVVVAAGDSLKTKVRHISTRLLPWQRAEWAARMARDSGLDPAEAINDPAISELFSLPKGKATDNQVHSDLVVGAGIRSPKKNNHFRVILSKRSPTGLRFELARLVGDELSAGPRDRWLLATGASTSRQKFQRAFAQEFLCPYQGLSEFFTSSEEPDEEAMEAAAAHYQVSSLLVKNTLVNHSQLERMVLEQ
ncbi:MAG: hypothetical protein U5O69_00955 [Candidatus Competibacteraceae bacterium]|nr:hypothetical protein [Candidatus Competibacteraceae bacterium]